MRVIIFSCQRRLRGAEYLAYGGCIGFPRLSLLAQLAAAFGCEPVELGLAVVLRKAPFRLDQALALEPPQCRLERAFFDQQRSSVWQRMRLVIAKPVQPAPDQGLENQDV